MKKYGLKSWRRRKAVGGEDESQRNIAEECEGEEETKIMKWKYNEERNDEGVKKMKEMKNDEK